MRTSPKPLVGGVIHTYQKYDPQKFPSPTQPPPDLVGPAFEHMLAFGDMREFTEEELARAIRLDPSQIAGLGPSIDALLAMLKERKRKILERYEAKSVGKQATDTYRTTGRRIEPPSDLRREFKAAFREEQIYDMERLWYRADRQRDQRFAAQIVQLMERLSEKYQIDELVSQYEFTGHERLSISQALAVKEELEKLDRLIEQLEQALETAQLAIVDMSELSEFTDPEQIENLNALQRQVEEYVRELAKQQGLENVKGRFRLTPQAFRLFQGQLLGRIFSQLQSSRTGRHQGPIVGEGSVELQQTKPYEFGDSVANMDIPASMINAMLRSSGERATDQDSDGHRVTMLPKDIEIHKTRNSPKCATVVLLDMSGSMRYDGQYINVKRMALALEGLIRKEYPGDFLQFVEVCTFARPKPAGEIASLLPKIPTLHDPVVRLHADMSRDDISEAQIPQHFTNLQHGLQLSRRFLATQDTPNRQVILITDGLPTAHFEDQHLFLLYPPDTRTEAATMREGALCQREDITINIFLLPSWSQTREDVQFAYRLAESTTGRVFFTAGRDLDRFVVWDYVNQKREIVG
ncbi:MAG: VWA domain-containing protein [Pirellulales bacterium]|nr:VWA domain-containing protein [Pirellulales bacterium]